MEVLWHCWLEVSGLGSIPMALVGSSALFFAVALRVLTIYFENNLKKEESMETTTPIKNKTLSRFKASFTHILSAFGVGCANGILLTCNDKDLCALSLFVMPNCH
jgi:hypothetical protein